MRAETLWSKTNDTGTIKSTKASPQRSLVRKQSYLRTNPALSTPLCKVTTSTAKYPGVINQTNGENTKEELLSHLLGLCDLLNSSSLS